MGLKPGTLVRAVWDDHTFQFNSWSKGEITRYETIGFLAEDVDGHVSIALTRDLQTGQFADVQTIDKRMLRSLKRLGA